jgi:hypothetical protein
MKLINIEEAKKIGNNIGINWDNICLKEFTMGINVELEHGKQDEETNITNDDLLITSKIAWAHLKKIKDYYTRLLKMESKAEKYWKNKKSSL